MTLNIPTKSCPRKSHIRPQAVHCCRRRTRYPSCSSRCDLVAPIGRQTDSPRPARLRTRNEEIGREGRRNVRVADYSEITLRYHPDWGPAGASLMAQATEVEQYAAARKDRKRRFVTYVVALNSFWVLVGLGIFSQADSRFDVSGRTVSVGVGAWFVGQIAAGVWLNRFRCPRCGKLFYWKWDWKIEGRREWRCCRHCGLSHDSAPA